MAKRKKKMPPGAAKPGEEMIDQGEAGKKMSGKLASAKKFPRKKKGAKK